MAVPRGMLDTALLHLSPQDNWDVRAALTHTLALGTTGSGKSSATLKFIIKSLLYQSFGALFCTAKAEDAEAYVAYCRQTGRLHSLIDWRPGHGGYNFLAAELARTGNINNLIDLLMAVLTMIRESGPNPGKSGDQFWIDSPSQMLRASVPVVYAATGTVRIGDLLDMIRTAPTSPEQMRDPDWKEDSAFFQYFRAAMQRLAQGAMPGFDAAAATRAMKYWQQFCQLDRKTASNIQISLATALSRFEHGILADMFCGETTICPELLMSGSAVILMNFPVQTYGEDAQIAQKLFKYCAQRVLLARNGMAPHLRERPCAIVADEADQFLFQDGDFLARCRSSLVAVVMAAQSLPILFSKIGGDHPHDRVHALISNFNNIVLHSTACPETAEWFARKVGKAVQRRASFNESYGTNSSYGDAMNEGSSWNREASDSAFFGHVGGFGWNLDPQWGRAGSEGGSDGWSRNRGYGSNHGTSQGWSEQVDWIIEPGFFSRGLKTGGPANGNRVSAVWYAAGRRFAASGGSALLVEFQQ